MSPKLPLISIWAVLLGLLRKVDEQLYRHDKVLNAILAELKGIREDNREFRLETSGLSRSNISQERDISDLQVRVDRLERKVK